METTEQLLSDQTSVLGYPRPVGVADGIPPVPSLYPIGRNSQAGVAGHRRTNLDSPTPAPEIGWGAGDSVTPVARSPRRISSRDGVAAPGGATPRPLRLYGKKHVDATYALWMRCGDE